MGYCTIRGENLSYDQRVEALSDRAHRVLMFAFYGPGRTSLGLRRFRLADLLSFAPTWTINKAQDALNEVVEAGLVAHDKDAQLLYLTVQFDHSPLVGVKTLQGAAKKLEEFPDSPILLPAINHMLQSASDSYLEYKEKRNQTSMYTLKTIILALKNRRENILAGPKKQENPKNPNPDAPSMGDPGLDSVEGAGSGAPQDIVASKNGAQFLCPIDGASGVEKFRLPEPEPEPEPEPPPYPPLVGHAAGGGGEIGGRRKERGKGASEYGKYDKH